MAEAVVHVAFKGNDILKHNMAHGSKEEAVAVAREIHDTYTRLLRTGIGSLVGIHLTIDVFIDDKRVVHFT